MQRTLGCVGELSLAQSPGGIEIGSADTGLGSPVRAIQVDLGLMPRFVVSSARWPKTAGVHLVSTLS